MVIALLAAAVQAPVPLPAGPARDYVATGICEVTRTEAQDR